MIFLGKRNQKNEKSHGRLLMKWTRGSHSYVLHSWKIPWLFCYWEKRADLHSTWHVTQSFFIVRAWRQLCKKRILHIKATVTTIRISCRKRCHKHGFLSLSISTLYFFLNKKITLTLVFVISNGTNLARINPMIKPLCIWKFFTCTHDARILI